MNAHSTIKNLTIRRKFILDIIQTLGPLTKNELLIKSKMKLTTLNREMTILLAKDIIIESSLADSTGGRKAALYDVNPYGFYLVGIDISRTYTKIVVTNLKFEIIVEKRIQIDQFDLNKAVLRLPIDIISIMESVNITISSVISVGIGLVSGVDSTLLKETLLNEFGIPVVVDKGANAAVIGEYRLGLGKGKQNIAFINCGVGIRTGAISSGVLLRTFNKEEDPLAHMIIEKEGNRCICGNHGCLETYVSINELPLEYKRMMKLETTSTNGDEPENISYLDICKLAENNNEIAMKVILKSAIYFGIGLTNFIRLLNPQLIILSGPYIQHSPYFYEETKRIVFKNLNNSLNEIEFSKGGYFKENSIAMGASVIAMRGIIER